MHDHPLGNALQIVYASMQKPISEFLRTVDLYLPGGVRTKADEYVLCQALAKDGWVISGIHGEIRATLSQGNVSVGLWLDSFSGSPWTLRWGLFKPWEPDQDACYQAGYLDHVEFSMTVPSDARFGNGHPICFIGFGTHDHKHWIEYWQPELMENQSHLPRGTHSEDERMILRILTLIGEDRIHHDKSSFKEPGDRLLREFHWPKKETT